MTTDQKPADHSADLEVGIAAARRIAGWQLLTRETPHPDDWFEATLRAMVHAALSATQNESDHARAAAETAEIRRNHHEVTGPINAPRGGPLGYGTRVWCSCGTTTWGEGDRDSVIAQHHNDVRSAARLATANLEAERYADGYCDALRAMPPVRREERITAMLIHYEQRVRSEVLRDVAHEHSVPVIVIKSGMHTRAVTDVQLLAVADGTTQGQPL